MLNGSKVRIRDTEAKASVAINGPRTGLCRSEFEYEIPRTDAEEILLTLCQENVLEKTPYSL